jgi:hypothetical protein
MAPGRSFPARITAALDAGKSLRIRAGSRSHRFIGIWVVVVRGRVFVRSWELGADGWFHTLRRERSGEIQIGGRILAISVRPVRSETMLAAVDQAYAAKYSTPGARKYVLGFRRGRRRASTTELLLARSAQVG